MMLKIKDDKTMTMINIMSLEWQFDSDEITVFCSDGDYCEIRFNNRYELKECLNSLYENGKAYVDTYVEYNWS